MMKRKPLLLLFFSAWGTLFALSFVVALFAPTDAAGMERGLERLSSFVGWQFAALISSLLAFTIGFGRFRGDRLYWWASKLPLMVQATLIALVAATVFYTRFSQTSSASLSVELVHL